MKKLINILATILITILSGYTLINAESIPTKKIDDEYALLENGVLVKAINSEHKYGITPNTKSEVVAENVLDFNIENVGLSKRITVLKNDGTLISRTGEKEEKIIDNNVSQMINDEIYLKNGKIYSLRYKHTYNNMKKILGSNYDKIYALDFNDTLYACINGKKIKIAENVLAYKNERIFNKNNEILSFDIDVNKGTTQLNLLANNVSYENFCAGIPVTKDNKIILYSNGGKILEKTENVKKPLNSYDTDYIHYLSVDNKLMLYNKYYYNFPISSKYGEIRELYNGETFKTASHEYAIGTNNNLYRLSLPNDKQLIDTDVDMVIKEGSNANPYIIYQKTNGDIYYYLSKYKEPFIYPLAQKQTKVILNGKNIQLEDNIQIKDGRSMYPFRAILEAMGATVMWDANNGIAIGILNNIRVGFKIGTNEYTINEEVKYMDTESYIDSLTERTYIPIRYMAEAFGYKVDWNAGDKENIITIKKGDSNNSDNSYGFSYELSAEEQENLADVGKALYKTLDKMGLKNLTEEQNKNDLAYQKLIIENNKNSKNRDCILDVSSVCVDGILAIGRTLAGDVEAGKSYIYDTSIGFVADATLDMIDNPTQDEIILAMCNSAFNNNMQYYNDLTSMHYKYGEDMTDEQSAGYVKMYQKIRINTRTLKMGSEYFDSKTSENFLVNIRDVVGNATISQIENIISTLKGDDSWTLVTSFRPGEDLNKTVLKQISKGIVTDFIDSQNPIFKSYGEDVERMTNQFLDFLE